MKKNKEKYVILKIKTMCYKTRYKRLCITIFCRTVHVSVSFNDTSPCTHYGARYPYYDRICSRLSSPANRSPLRRPRPPAACADPVLSAYLMRKDDFTRRRQT